MRWRSLHTILAVSLGSPRRLRELRVWSVKMVPAVPTRMGQMLTSYLQSLGEVVVQEAMLSSGFVELSCVDCIMAELEFKRMILCLFLSFLGLLEISV
jgi:hypothetical protein